MWPPIPPTQGNNTNSFPIHSQVQARNLVGTSNTSPSSNQLPSSTNVDIFFYFHYYFYHSPFYKCHFLSGLLHWSPCICFPSFQFNLHIITTNFLKPLNSCPLLLGYRKVICMACKVSYDLFPTQRFSLISIPRSLVSGALVFWHFLVISKVPPNLHMLFFI